MPVSKVSFIPGLGPNLGLCGSQTALGAPESDSEPNDKQTYTQVTLGVPDVLSVLAFLEYSGMSQDKMIFPNVHGGIIQISI